MEHDEVATLQWIANTMVIYLTVSFAFLVYTNAYVHNNIMPIFVTAARIFYLTL